MRKKFALKISLSLLVLAIIILALAINEGISTDDLILHWRSYLLMLIALLFIANLVYLNHLTHHTYGQDHSDDFFNFPINFIAAMATLVCFWQIASDADTSRIARERKIMNDISSFSENIVIDTWEKETMASPKLHALYNKTLGATSGSSSHTYLTKEEWHKLHPIIPYFPYEGNEQKWHYAGKFCQQMINIIRMFDLTSSFRINSESDREKSVTSAYGGWVTGFRMYMQHPLIRNVWEQNKTRFASPDITAWVQFFVIDPLEDDLNFWETHASNWDKNIQKYLKRGTVNPSNANNPNTDQQEKISSTIPQSNQ